MHLQFLRLLYSIFIHSSVTSYFFYHLFSRCIFNPLIVSPGSCVRAHFTHKELLLGILSWLMHVPQFLRSAGCVFSSIYGALVHPCSSKYRDSSPLFAIFTLKRRKAKSPTNSSLTADSFFSSPYSWTSAQLPCFGCTAPRQR